VDAFFGSLPGHGVENIRRPLIHTGNLADMMPTSTIWSGEAAAPCPMYPPSAPALMHCVTSGHTPFRLNIHVRDLGHGIMLGPTRAGKSTHLALLIAQFRRYRGARVVGFDKGLSMYPICKAVGGQHYNIGADGADVSFCPLQFLKTKADRAWAMEWIDIILKLNGVETTPRQRNEIGIAIENMNETGQKTMTDFVMNIQDQHIREALKQYTMDGLMGGLLDASEDGLALADFCIFEIEQLLDMSDKYVIPVLLYLFRRIDMMLDGRPTLVPMDEVWIMFGKPVALQKLRDWLKSVAKKNCAIFMATQNLSDAAKSGIMDVITESTATKIFLPNPYARNDDATALYKSMGLNARLIEEIANAVPKRDYLYVSEKGRRMYQLALGPVAKAFVGATDKESIARIRSLEATHGSRWPKEWLKESGVNVHFSG
jgi:type IV secretion system protein TrbE